MAQEDPALELEGAELSEGAAVDALAAGFASALSSRIPFRPSAAAIAAHAGEIGSGAGEVEKMAAAVAAERAGDDGPVTLTTEDRSRFRRQLDQVRDLMADGRWRTLAEIKYAIDAIERAPMTIGISEASVSARLRDLRKPAYGRYAVTRRRRDPALPVFEYQVMAPAALELEAGGADRG